jgi:2'-5' RNA ligase
MYDYVLQYGFNREMQNTIQEIKNCLKENGVEDKERNWLPHITIDLYNCKNRDEFINKLDKIIENIDCFRIDCKNLNNFGEETLYIDPYDKEELLKLKLVFDEGLQEYRIENRKMREYRPHITLCTNDDLTKAKEIANKKFKAIIGRVEYVWVYDCNMNLIREYKLKTEK